MAQRKGTKKNPLTFKIKKGTKDIRCPKCKFQCFIDGSGWMEVPIGFGARGGKFVVDKVRRIGWFGECPKHGKIFAYHSQKIVTRTPRGINVKIRAMSK